MERPLRKYFFINSCFTATTLIPTSLYVSRSKKKRGLEEVFPRQSGISPLCLLWSPGNFPFANRITSSSITSITFSQSQRKYIFKLYLSFTIWFTFSLFQNLPWGSRWPLPICPPKPILLFIGPVSSFASLHCYKCFNYLCPLFSIIINMF